jgi:hypothetical protein
MRFLKYIVCIMSLLFMCLGCDVDMRNIGPQDIGIILTPSGYEQTIYSPGQVNIGDLTMGKGNTLILIQRSGVDSKESFSLPGSEDKDRTDHRCLLGNQTPITFDVRVLLALPDYEKPEGLKELQRAIALGNPTYPNKDDIRVMRIDAISIYDAQARQQVREAIRILCTSYKDFDSIFLAFGDVGEGGLSKKLQKIVADSLRLKNVPLTLISAGPSNLKPDKEIMQARASKQAAQIRNEAVQIVTDFLDQDRTGVRRMVYQMQVWKEIVSTGNANGHNTILFSTNGGGSANLIPIVNPGGKPVSVKAETPATPAAS